MGRGRQKAKHTKVARELKYSVPETDYTQLQRELAGSRNDSSEANDELSKWSEYLDDEYDEDDEEFDGYAQKRA